MSASTLAFLLLVLNQQASARHNLKLVAHEKDRVVIPCFNGNNSLLMWVIHGISYPVSRLPLHLIGISNGLVAQNISEQDEGQYTCYGLSNNGFELFSSAYFVVEHRSEQVSGDSGDNFEPQAVGDYGTELTLKVTEKDIFYIPCLPVTGSDVALLWELNGWFYPDIKLPAQHFAHYGGIVALNASLSHLRSNYTCYTIGNGVSKRYTVYLQVSEAPIHPPNNEKLDSDHLSDVNRNHYFRSDVISMAARKVDLQPEQKLFGFVILNDNDVNCNRLYSNSTQSDWNDSTTSLVVSIPSSVLAKKEAFIETYRTYANGTSCEKFKKDYRVNMSEITQKQCTPVDTDACIDVEPYFKDGVLLYAKWPERNNSDEDCLCPVTKTTPFEKCYCFNGITVYNVTLRETQLCWNNLSQITNETSILLIDETQSNDWLIRKQRKIIAHGPQPQKPIVTQDNDNKQVLHIQSNSTNEWNPILNTSVTTQDITGDTIQNINKSEEDFSINYADFPRCCAPYQFSFTAYTECTQSPPALFTDSETGNKCDCLKAKFKTTASVDRVTSEAIYLNLNITCLDLGPSSTYSIHWVSNLYARAISFSSDKGEITEFVFIPQTPCDSETEVVIDRLNPNTVYNISILWISLDSSCQISATLQDVTQKDLPLIIGLTVSLVIAVIVVLILLIVALYFCVKKKCSKPRRSGRINFSGERSYQNM